MKLYACLGSGNCFKPWLAMHQLDISFDMQLIDVLAGEQKSDPYLAINPMGVVPYLMTDTDLTIGESNAMLWYITEDTHLAPKTRADRAEALQWMFFEQSKLEPFISPARFFTTILPSERANQAANIAQWQAAAAPGLSILEKHLASREFMLSSGYTITDIAIFGYVHVMDEAGITMHDYPAISRWIDAVCKTDRFIPLSTLGKNIQTAA